MKNDPKEKSEVVKEMEEIRDQVGELNPDEDLTWANTANSDMGINDYE